jgi:hypothetical protein
VTRTVVGATGAFMLHGWGQRYFEILNDIAKRLRDQGHHEMAVVAAQTACEVFTELVVTTTFKNQNIGHLAEPVEALMPNYNLGNDRVRKLYEALCNDPISQQPFWSRYKTHVKRRHGIVHEGKQTDRAGAEESIKAVEEVIYHIQNWFGAG